MSRPKATLNLGAAAALIGFAVAIAGGVGCSSNSAKSHFILAERFWADGKYAAAVSEFEKVTQREPNWKLGLQSLFRAAMTQTLYLSQHEEAIRKLRQFVVAVKGGESAHEANRQIGEILFTKLERYPDAIKHYKALLAQEESLAPVDAGEYAFRVSKAQFFLWQFGKAIDGYREIRRKYPRTHWAERAGYEIGAAYYTSGERGRKGVAAGGAIAEEKFQAGIDAFDEFIHEHPDSRWVPEAKFGIAACLEELDQLDAALVRYQAVKKEYPSPLVVDVRIARIKERQNQKRR